MKIYRNKKNTFLIIIGILFFFIKSNAQVWPADANNNGIVNNVDFIFTGVAFESGGPSRLIADQGIDWNPKPATDWTGSFNSIGVNYKHADADGNGFIGGADLYSINNYYDTTNVNFTTKMGNVIHGNDLYLTFSDTVIEAGDTVTITINLGTLANPVNNIHGVAFSIGFDTSKIKEIETTLDFHGGWLGTPDVDLYAISKYDETINIERADFAATKGPFGTVSGYGEIGKIVVIIEEDLAGKKSQKIGSLTFNFENVLGIDSLAFDMNITCKNDTLIISDGIIDGIEKLNIIKVVIYPNPTNYTINILTNNKIQDIALLDITGKKVSVNIEDKSIDVSGLNQGIYYLKMKVDNSIVVKKVIIN